MIDLICPSKGRPEKLARMWDSARKTAYDPDLLHLNAGINEEEVNTYKAIGLVGATIYPVKDWSTVYSLNYMADKALRQSDSRLFMIVGDDTIFSTPGWDKALRTHYGELKTREHVYSLRDSRDENGTPHPIATREYIHAMGYLATPIFMHWYVDHWMAEIARANNCFTHLKDYLLVHEKPSDKGMPDLTHTSIRARGWHERDKFTHEHCKHFLAMEKDRLGVMIDYRSGKREHLD